jgi:predicted phosphodiesterase
MSLRVLAVADEIADALYGDTLNELRPDLIVSCGDLPFDYLENLVSRTDRPLLYVPGNHDPTLKPPDPTLAGWSPMDDGVGPRGCIDIDRRIVRAGGLTIAGLGGSVQYRDGPNQYTQRQMARRALALELRARVRRSKVDILITHAPPAGFGDADDAAHAGFTAFHRLVKQLGPRYLIHGHVRHFGPKPQELRLGSTVIVNAIPYKLIEV